MRKEDDVLRVLRVGVANNFNFTAAEEEAISKLDWPMDKIFVNSNSFVTIKDTYPSFITVNPYLDSFVEPKGDLGKVKACRIKFVYSANNEVDAAIEQAILWCIKNKTPMLITFMRFANKDSLTRFTDGSEAALSAYKFKGNYYRLTAEYMEVARRLISEFVTNSGGNVELVNYCDFAGEGCPACGNCAKLSMGIEEGAFELYGVNLEESGDAGSCIFHCPDCWAKRIANYRKPVYGKITQNSKQSGYKIKH